MPKFVRISKAQNGAPTAGALYRAMRRVLIWLVALARYVVGANSNAMRLEATVWCRLEAGLPLGHLKRGRGACPGLGSAALPGWSEQTTSHVRCLAGSVLTLPCRSRRMTQAFAGDDGDRAGLDEVRARLPRGLPRGLARRPRRLPSRSCPFRPLTCVVRVVGRYEPTACMSATTTNETTTAMGAIRCVGPALSRSAEGPAGGLTELGRTASCC